MVTSRFPVLRGSILMFLSAVYPEQVEEETIIKMKYQFYEPRDIRKALEYLVGRAYVERVERKHPVYPEKHMKFYKILPAGVDVADGVAEDRAVLVDEEL